ncbi:MAG: hypothetical protein J0M04_05490 [Verrucomicrobia bacterium]|nr:hypothetical protein [Verrucomicrobiota bacterium]
MFSIAAETGWPEERILFMPLARLFQYRHCLLRRNGVRTVASSCGPTHEVLRSALDELRKAWYS